MAHSDCVWITHQYSPLICYSFNCQQILFIYSLPPENICFCLLYSHRDWTRLDPFFPRISPYVARAKSKSIKPRRKSYSVRTLIPSTHSRLFESCSSFYFPLPEIFLCLKTPPKVERVPLIFTRAFPNSPNCLTLEPLPATRFYPPFF